GGSGGPALPAQSVCFLVGRGRWTRRKREVRFSEKVPMCRIVQIIVVLLLGVGSALAGPRAECAAPVYEFGSVSSTAVVAHVFVIANTGGAPLKIDGVRVCCGAF
ncbi:MAG: DUF1573 domain-containing protein, partial [bacterium]